MNGDQGSREARTLIRLAEMGEQLQKLQSAVRAVLAEPYLLDPGCAEDQALVDKLKELVP